MMFLPLQYDGHRGPDAIGSHKITFSIDESVDMGDFNPMSIKKGTQFIVMLVEAGTEEAEEFRGETLEETKNRFRKRMNAIIGDIAELKSTKKEDEREEIKAKFIKEGIIKKSTSELSIDELAKVISRLTKYKNELTTGPAKPR